MCAEKEKVESADLRAYHGWLIRCELGRVIDVKRCRRQLQELACLALVLGLAHGLLLCVGCDGHAELHSGLHTHDHTGAAVPLDRQAADHHEDEHSHCSRCVDIPLSMVAVDGPLQTHPTSVLACLQSADHDINGEGTGPRDLCQGRAAESISYFTPLSSIILVV